MTELLIADTFTPPSSGRSRSTGLVLAGILLVLLSAGCQGPRAMREVFMDYSQSYADNSNQQLLLNLARRANGHPAYFLQMGSINSTFQYSTTVNGNTAQNRTRASGGALAAAAALSDTLTLGGALGLSASEQPSFSFTPLGGSSFAAAIFNPIDPRVFFNLFEQGMPVDQLLRAMVQSVTLVENGTAHTYVNVPDPNRATNYRNFLTVAGLARELQKDQLLLSAPDHLSFVLAPGAFQRIMTLRTNTFYRYEDEGSTYVFEDPTAPKKTGDAISFRLRTFQGVLTALARENDIFDHFMAEQGDSFSKHVPPGELRPALRIRHNPSAKNLSQPLAEITYFGKKYSITDEEIPSPGINRKEYSTWNRDVFDLLNLLYIQISLDPSKLPMQQLIQIH